MTDTQILVDYNFIWEHKTSNWKYGFENEATRKLDIDIYVNKIHKLEQYAHGDRVFMDLMQRKLKDIGSEQYQYVMKIQTKANETTQQLREQTNALLQTIWALGSDKEHLESVLLDKQLERRFQPHRHQRRQYRGYFRWKLLKTRVLRGRGECVTVWSSGLAQY